MRSLIGIFLLPIICLGQDYSIFTSTVDGFYKTASQSQTDSLWDDLVTRQNIPLVVHDSVAFLYKGDAQTVAWMGDFNGWGYDQTFPSKGKKIPGTDVWLLKASFPKDARLDYKILVNDKNWIIDPSNPNHQWTGLGGGSPNSELRMPGWSPDPATIYREGIQRGKVESDLLFDSKLLGYQLTILFTTLLDTKVELTTPCFM